MDQSCSESDVSLSPSQLLERLQVLRQLQLLQRGKLQKQRLQYHQTSETSSSITEIVSHFSNSTSYNTFRSLLQSSCDVSNEVSPRPDNSNLAGKVQERDLMEGVTALNLSQESEFIINSPLSSKSRVSVPSRNEQNAPSPKNQDSSSNQAYKKQISLDDIPILSPKKDFEAMLLEKLQKENIQKATSPKKKQQFPVQTKKPFLRKGQGMARFGVQKNDLVIQNTKSLPWRKKSLETRVVHTPKKVKNSDKNNVQIMIKEIKEPDNKLNNKSELKLVRPSEKRNQGKPSPQSKSQEDNNNNEPAHSQDNKVNESGNKDNKVITRPLPKLQLPTGKHPLKANRGKTWAAVLTKEQDDFLRQLKQSDYYKNFVSPAKSAVSDVSGDDYLTNLRQEREVAEQNMFDLLENKVANESFNLENSFFAKFLKRSMECSGESTPLMMKKCLANNPLLLHIFPDVQVKNDNHTECSCEYTDCSDTNSVCSGCSCKSNEDTTLHESPKSNKKDLKQRDSKKPKRKDVDNENSHDTCNNDKTITETDEMKANMAEMNEKLAATSELLKERLRELEDEIETFRKENNNLAKLREEVDLERQKFYEEKNAFESKLNEEKILSEYYLAEEKEKLNKQKQMYERYVREIRGRLNKKEKDEVINLKKEINDLKEEIRLKDTKSTTIIARLRNQLKIAEKEKASLQDEVEKLKKENRRIQHSNEITRRLTNVKYLEQINNKLNKMSKSAVSEVDLDSNVKYKAFEIERQSRSRNVQPTQKGTIRQRAKSVPNLNVTSRYAKYFSQRDALSNFERNESYNIERTDKYPDSENQQNDTAINVENAESSDDNDEVELNNEDENNLEKIYMERFRNASPVDTSSRCNSSNDRPIENPDPFFIRKSASNSCSSKLPSQYRSHYKSPVNAEPSKPSISATINKSYMQKQPVLDPVLNYSSELGNTRSKSPVSILSTHSSSSQKSATVINQEQYRDRLMNVSPEPSTSKTSQTKTNLYPIEIKKSDGSKELRFPNGNVKYISADGKYSKFVYYNGDVKENFYSEGRIKYYYSESKTYHTTHPDGLEVLEFPDGQVEKRYKDGSTEIRLPNGSIRYHDPKNEHVREEWRFPDGTSLTVSATGEQRIVFANGQVEVHAKDHKRREFPDGTVKLVYNDGTSETRYASGRVRIKDKHGNLIMDSAPG